MNLDRKGMLVCFIVLYRILLVDIFKRYLFYFKKIREMDVDELYLLETYEKKLENYEEKLKEKYRKNKIHRGKMSDIEEEEQENDDEIEKKIFDKDEQDENEESELEKNEKNTKKGSSGTSRISCPPKKKSSEESSEESSDEEEEEEDDEEEESDSKTTKSKNNKKSSSIKKSESSKTSKKTKTSKSKTSTSKKSSQNTKKDNLKGEEYGYAGYLDKKKGKSYHKKGVYFDDEREKEVPKDILKEEERQREEKLKQKLEQSNSSKSSIEEEESSESEQKSKDKKSKSSKTSKSKTSSHTSKPSSKSKSNITSSEISSSQKSKKPQNINEEFWGHDLEAKEMEERNKNKKPVKEQLDPYQKRKERIKKLPKEMRIKILEEERSKLNLKIKHNFHVISNILHSIFKSAMIEYVPLFSEYYKEKFLYKALVFQKTHEQYSNGNDEIELSKGIIIDEESTEIFLTKNQRWAQMYKLLTFQFCRDFAIKCREGK